MKTIDARGLACPQPVVRAKQALDAGVPEFEILVDDEASRENLLKFAGRAGAVVESVVAEEGVFRLRLRKAGAPPAIPEESPSPSPRGRTLFVAREMIGQGSEELGKKLMQVFLETLQEIAARPSTVILMNGGVRLAVENPATIESLRRLEASGVEVLVCGACLDYYGLKDRLQAGKISNMFAIAEILLEGPPVVAL